MSDKYNVEAAEKLANEALHLPVSAAVPIYEQLLLTYPTAAKFWKQYVEAHMVENNDDAVKQLFSRCLLDCLQISLWRCYIRFIRKANDKKGIEGQEETRKAYDFMLNCVGEDIAAGPVWIEYITFLKSLPAHSAQEESQRMIAVRKVYQKAIVTPTHHVEQLWRDYENFENTVSRQLAKGLISEYQPKYNSARAVYRERKKYVDEIDWNMLAVPPSGANKEELQWVAWKRLLAFEKENPQRVDSTFANKRIVFTYDQCLMYLYHYPDIWYDYATWHAKSGSVDSAIKVFHRALKALPDSELLKYAYAELEESRGSVQPAKKTYEGLLKDPANTTALSHIQFIRFLRRTEGVEAARRYFLAVRDSPSCTYQVYVAYAMVAFCLDKDAKVAHNVFELGLKHYMQEPGYILEYADFLSRLNDDRNIRALFERALSALPPEKSVEVWKRFTQFEQTYGDLASMLKVEQRRKEALSGTGEESASALESSLQEVVSRYSFMDLWPCSSNDLDNLVRQEWLSKNIKKKNERISLSNGAAQTDKASSGVATGSNQSTKVIYPDTSRMMVYDPRQKPGAPAPEVSNLATLSSLSVPSIVGGTSNSPNDILRAAPPALASFIASLPAVEGPSPDVDFVLSICMQSNFTAKQTGKPGTTSKQMQGVAAPSSSDISGPNKSHPVPNSSAYKPTRDRQTGKRKDFDRQDDNDTVSVQSQPLPKDVFKLRQMRKARATGSQTGSASYGSASAFSGDLSASSG
ncbi:Cleavage stimulation factor subunit 3 [Heracleum sosnowskyi]|uniref:Cleavage stimulation factor subunit 3 n=1 Tax=Heracleum sosnowskyi TaxID=360622 RepID=A0AAD8H0P3_9APIA|nr:Cleavage stimulation factor subunit 3 [Heracleum sosnowskyi]